MTIYHTIKDELELHPDFRERRFRDKTLIRLVLEKHNKDEVMFVNTSFLPEFAKDYMSFERIWRLVLRENPELRGSDWVDGKALSENYQIKELGREVGYHELSTSHN